MAAATVACPCRVSLPGGRMRHSGRPRLPSHPGQRRRGSMTGASFAMAFMLKTLLRLVCHSAESHAGRSQLSLGATRLPQMPVHMCVSTGAVHRCVSTGACPLMCVHRCVSTEAAALSTILLTARTWLWGASSRLEALVVTSAGIPAIRRLAASASTRQDSW